MNEMWVTDVTSITLRKGDKEEVDVIVATKDGDINLRLLPKKAKPIRVVDLRTRDKRKRNRLVTVPFSELVR